MTKKERMLIISFDTTTQAMAMEAACKRNGIPGRIIPLPEAVSAGCGLSWSAPPEVKEQILAFMREQELTYDQCCEIDF